MSTSKEQKIVRFRPPQINSETDSNYNSNKSSKTKIIIGISIAIVFVIILAVVLVLLLRKKEDNISLPPGNSPPIIPITTPIELNLKKLLSEFEFATKEGDLQRILVKQKYKEDRLIDGEKVTTFFSRVTNYDIYIISEKNSTEENKLFYDKIYTCAISIQSECFIDKNEECLPKTRLDLTNKIAKNTEEARNLEEKKDLKDLPIPICLFNLTNNDVITSIECPESFPEAKKKMLILDLYFFRPPGIKRLKDNFNSTITKKTEENKKYIHETNEGICDIENSQFSFCTTDMNTTTNLDNKILEYNEVAIMNITTDNQNSYIKTKTTKLVDESDKVENFDPEIYEENLNNIINKLSPYLKYDELFSKENFQELLFVSKNGMAEFKKMGKRKLDTYDEHMIKKENNVFNLFTPESGIEVDLTLFNNVGINSDFMEANNIMYIDNNKTSITQSTESSKDFNSIIKDLIVFSQAGNHLATELFQKTNISLENMMEEINKAISTLNEIIKYKDLSEIFDSTLSLDNIKDLPYIIIQETNILRQKLDELLENVENGGIKKNIQILNQNIYDYIDESHRILNGLFNNLKELSISLSSSKSKLTEISTYYLNNTPTSYISVIRKAQDILSNYYKDEYNLIAPQVENILNDFEKKLKESLNKEIKIIDNLYDKIENKNYSIKDANEEELKQILNNLYYTKTYIKEIIEKIKTKARKEMNIKGNGYFISDYDLNSNEDSFSKIIESSSRISSQLDNDEFIDTAFDGIMKNIKSNFTSILKNMEKKKEELFPMDDDVLKSSTFTLKFQNDMKNDIGEKSVDISNKIRRENDYYLEAKQKVIEEFLDKNKDELNNLVSELDNLFSVIKLEELANLYEKAFNSSLQKTINEINYNKNLSYEYFIGITELIDNKNLIELLSKYHIDEEHLPYCISRVPHHEVYLTRFSDLITSKSKTRGYLIKYNLYKDNLENSKSYINDQLYQELLLEYKNVMSDIRQILQVFKNNKLSDRYPDLNELSFIDDHIRIIDNFYNRLDKFISDDLFNNRYIDIMEEYKDNENKELLNINNNIEFYHKIIDSYPLDENFDYDFCLTYQRKKTYTCVNGCVGTYYNSDNYCLPAFSISNNHLNLTGHSIDTDMDIIQFRSVFKEFNDSLSEKINLYTSKINEFKQSLIDIETETINQNFTLDYLSPINDVINSLLSDKYGDQIINASYNYYQPNIEERIESLLDDISSQWFQFFDDIKTDINNNLSDFKNSITELANMCGYFSALLANNITNNYFNSIVEHQKTEFNYTITYYYNVLLKLVKSNYQYVLSKLPSNQVGFNNLVNLRKSQINEFFINLIKNIENSQKEALNFEQQIFVVEVADTNFFGINEILKNNVINTQTSLDEKLSEIRKLRNRKNNDEFSLSSRFYLEISESGKQIEELYEQIIEKVFVYLNLDQFKELLIENWIFDQDEFIKNLNDILYNSNLEVQKEFKIKKEEYIKSFEEEITKDYTKDNIATKINNLYKNEIKSLKENQINDIKQNINDILDKIKQEFTEEANELKEKANSHNKDFTKIEDRIKKYKERIIEKMKTNIFSVIDEFNKNVNIKIYTNFFEKSLNEYISESENTINDNDKIVLLSDTYYIGQIINSIIIDICNNYKKFIEMEIDSNYNTFYSQLENLVNIKDLERLIKEKIDENYNLILFPALEQVATEDIGIQGYNAYDLNDNILNNIDNIITEKITNIKNIIDTTKGDNYDFNLKDTKIWPKMDFSIVYQKIKRNLGDLSTFISDEKENEKEKVEKFLEEIMISNFDDLLENIIPSFGNNFFERIIKYNENFKISSLYNTLKYSLIPTCTYFLSLGNSKIKALTKDLKLKIYSLNDLDKTSKNRNTEVLELLNKTVEKFVQDSQDFIVGKYISFFNNDVSIKQNYGDGIVYQSIINKLYHLEDKFKDDYTKLLNEYLTDKLITSYTKVMKEKTNEMVLSVEEKRELLKSKIDDLFSLDPDTVLQDINIKINNTLNSIEHFNSHFKLFNISNNLKNYLNDFGTNNIQPKFEGLMDILNRETKDEIINTIDKNSEEYINYFNDAEFIEKSDASYNEIKEKYIENINSGIIDYGKEEYLDKLEKEIGRISDKIRRRRERLLSEEEIENDRRERIADKAIDNTFSKLLSSSKNTKKFIDNLEKFDNFDKIINENINKLNIAYKKSSNRIKENNYIEEVNNNLTTRLSDLKNITLEYYTNINNSFYNLKNYLKNSINDIYNDLYQCANITYRTFAGKYENLSKVEQINTTIDNTFGEEIKDSKIIDNQGKITTVNYTISNIMKKAKFLFNFELEEEGEIKKPRLKASVINLSRPGKIKIKFINSQPETGDIIQYVDVDTQNANFTININYNTSSKDLYVTNIVDFESFQFSKELVKIPLNSEEMEENCYWVDGVQYCDYTEGEYSEDNPEILSSKKEQTIEGKKFTETSVIHESELFDFIVNY